MKKIVLILVLLSFNLCFAQSGWIIIERNQAHAFSFYSFLNGQTGYASTYGGAKIFKTTDGGYSWQDLNSYYPNAYTSDLLFINESTGFISHNFLRRTTNSGINWEFINPSNSIYGLKYFNDVLYSCGSGIQKSTDLGNTWSNLYTLDSFGVINRMQFLDNNNFFAAGIKNQRGFLLNTTDGGNNWSSLPVRSFLKSTTDIKFFDYSTCLITGINLSDTAVVYKTTDGGNSFIRKGYEISYTEGAVFLDYLNGNTVYISGRKDLFKSTNSGETFYSVYNTPGELYSSYFLNQSTGILSGYDTVQFLAKTTNGGVGIQNIGFEIPDKFYLSQNYPNPFNPVTNIEFSLPQKSFVKLKVFDLLGREVANLVNENLSAGSYKYDFNASLLSSGIYFYKLETENFSETRKMILIK